MTECQKSYILVKNDWFNKKKKEERVGELRKILVGTATNINSSNAHSVFNKKKNELNGNACELTHGIMLTCVLFCIASTEKSYYIYTFKLKKNIIRWGIQTNKK